MPEVNHAEIENIIGYIEAHPEEWNQQDYASRYECQTAYCVAGHACVRAGYTFQWEDGRTWATHLDDGHTPISHRARQLLGLTDDQAITLFQASNTIDDLKRISKSFHDQVV
jgi:hypothetical protein